MTLPFIWLGVLLKERSYLKKNGIKLKKSQFVSLSFTKPDFFVSYIVTLFPQKEASG